MNTKANPPGWDGYLATLRELEARHWINPAAAADMQRAGRALAMVAWETGADQMTEEAAKIMRRRAERDAEPVPGPATLRQMVAEGYGRGQPAQAAGGDSWPASWPPGAVFADGEGGFYDERAEPLFQAAGGTCKGPGPCPNQDTLDRRLDKDCPVCGGRDPLPF